MQTDTYNFPVAQFPITADNVDIPNRFAVIRTDTNQPLGIVSEKYSLIPHENVISGMRESLIGHKFEENIKVVKDGAQLFATYTLRDMEQEVAKGDVVGMQLTVRNSYDGSSPVQLSLGALRLVCTNGMTLSKKFMNFSQRHLGEAKAVDFGEMQEKISLYSVQFGDLVPVMNQMTNEEFTPVDKSFSAQDTKIPAYIMKEASAEYEKAKDNTVWGYYNSLTYAITHQMRKETPMRQASYNDRAWQLASNALAL